MTPKIEIKIARGLIENEAELEAELSQENKIDSQKAALTQVIENKFRNFVDTQTEVVIKILEIATARQIILVSPDGLPHDSLMYELVHAYYTVSDLTTLAKQVVDRSTASEIADIRRHPEKNLLAVLTAVKREIDAAREAAESNFSLEPDDIARANVCLKKYRSDELKRMMAYAEAKTGITSCKIFGDEEKYNFIDPDFLTEMARLTADPTIVPDFVQKNLGYEVVDRKSEKIAGADGWILENLIFVLYDCYGTPIHALKSQTPYSENGLECKKQIWSEFYE